MVILIKFLLVVSILTLFSVMPSVYAANWYDDGVNVFQYAKNMSIPNAEYPNSDLTNFPFLVNITDTDVGSKAQSDCDDIVFTSRLNNSKLSHEIENCDLTTNDWFTAWVKLERVNSTATQDNWFMMYYGDSDTSSQENVEGTWNSNYRAVYHLHDDFLDSTANNNDGTNNGSTDFADTWIADSQDFDGTNDYIIKSDTASLSPTSTLTISAWVDIDGTGRYILAGKGNGAGPSTSSYWLESTITNVFPRLYISNGVSEVFETGTTSMATGWHLITGVMTGTGALIYLDGAVDGGAASSITGINNDAQSFAIGRLGDLNSLYTNGRIDEVRVLGAAMSADWIAFEYCNQRDQDDCDSLDVGPEGTEPAGGSTVTVSDEIALEDSGATAALATAFVSDEIALEDTASAFISSSTVNVSDEIALEDAGAESLVDGIVTVSDEIALEDGGSSAGSNVVFVSDEIALEDVSDASAPQPAFNAIVLSLNSPTSTRLGGVFSGVCDFGNNYTMIGIWPNGTIRCAQLP